MKLCRQYEFQLIDLNWERIFLKFQIRTDCCKTAKFALAKFSYKEQKGESASSVNVEKMIEICPDDQQKNVYFFTLNMAAADGRKFLENGQWRMVAFVEEELCVVSISNALAYQLESKTRIFPYGERKYSYNVFFTLNSECDDRIEMFLNSYFMQLNNDWQKKRYIQEADTIKKKCKSVFTVTAISGVRLFYRIIEKLFPKNGKRILFMSETRESLWGNLKYIEARMKERGMDKEYEFNYSFRKVLGKRHGISSWVRTLLCIAKSDYIFIDDYAPIFGYLNLTDRTKLIQVWHAGEGFKSVGYSRFGKDGSPHPGESAHKKYDYVTVGSKKLVHVYEEVFGIEKEAFLPTGMARLDDFMNQDKIAQFKRDFYKQYPKLQGKKVILFAPTFRGTGQKEAYYDYDMLDLKQIYDFCGEEFVFLAKVHPFVTEKIQIPEEYRERIYDFAEYPNINDLYYITDVLITDYSSNYYEYALLEKPVLFYTYDREKYELIRGVHRSVKEHAPGKVCDTFEELMDALYQKDYEFEKIEQFVADNFGEYDGRACDRIIDQIILKK